MQIKLQKSLCPHGQEYYKKICSVFGNSILDESKNINRRKFAGIIFSDIEKKQKLDSITLEYVVPKIKEIAENKRKNKDVVIDAPLLFESNLDKYCDVTVSVVADKDKCIERIS